MLLDKPFYSTEEAAKILKISRTEVWRKIKAGELQAEKFGRSFAITKESLSRLLPAATEDSKENEIIQAVKQVVKEYGSTLKKLGKE